MSRLLLQPRREFEVDRSHFLIRQALGVWPMRDGGGPSFRDGQLTPVTGAFGAGTTWMGDIITMDGTDDYASLGTALNPTNPYFSLWFRLLSLPSAEGTLVGKKVHGTGALGGWELYSATGGGLTWKVTTGFSWDRAGSPGTAIVGKWHHVFCYYQGGNVADGVSGYLDGVKGSSATQDWGADTTNNLRFGTDGDLGNYLNVQVMNFILWNGNPITGATGSAGLSGIPDLVKLLYHDPWCYLARPRRGFIAVVGTGAQTISPTGIASTAAIGTHKINQTISPSGIASTAAVGSHQLNLKIAPSGISSTATVGSHLVSAGGLTIQTTGIGSTAVVGSHTITPGGVTIVPSGISSTAAVGSHQLNLKIAPSGISSTVAAGTPSITKTITIAGIASTAAVGLLTITPGPVTITVTGIASSVVFGTTTISVQGAVVILPTHVTVRSRPDIAVVVSWARTAVVSGTLRSPVVVSMDPMRVDVVFQP